MEGDEGRPSRFTSQRVIFHRLVGLYLKHVGHTGTPPNNALGGLSWALATAVLQAPRSSRGR